MPSATMPKTKPPAVRPPAAKASPAPQTEAQKARQDIIEYSNAIRERMRKYLEGTCTKCGGPNLVTRVSERADVDRAGLWRFVRIEGATMIRASLDRIDAALDEFDY